MISNFVKDYMNILIILSIALLCPWSPKGEIWLARLLRTKGTA